MSSIRYCYECGSRILSTHKFCRSCGSAQPLIGNAQHIQAKQPVAEPPIVKILKTSHFTKGQYFALWAIIWSVLVGFGFMVFFSIGLTDGEDLADTYVWASLIVGTLIGLIIAYNHLIFARKPFKSPKVVDKNVFDDAERKRVITGAAACWVIAGFSALFAVISIFNGTTFGVTPFSLVDAAMFATLGLGIFRYSLLAAVVAVILYILEQIYGISEAVNASAGGQGFHYGLWIPLIILVALIQSAIPLWQKRKLSQA